ncbi:MAG: chemotaxis protein CheW [Acetobacteraceae bacterium]|nr:chemotaxis protein CheW [Acetobacteraceae bacterium]
MDELLADFLTETSEALAECASLLVQLEHAPDDQALVGHVFRLVHTIKGTCGFLGLSRLERVAHAAETLLDRFRDGTLAVTPSGITLVLRALDAVRAIVAGLEATRAEPPGNDGPLIADLDAAAGEAPAAAAGTAPLPAPAAPEQGGGSLLAGQGTGHSPEYGTGQSIRVRLALLEELMTEVSELVLARNQLLQLARHEPTGSFTAPLQRLSRITTCLQEGVMKLRMQPIGRAWSKLPRLVRDLGHELGKTIELVERGTTTELDRQVLELVTDPLTHMVRNSADHGLETPAERRRAGKPEAGRISLNAFHEAGQIVIEVADDGRGLATGAIRAKALGLGLASEAELAAMGDQQIQQFIFRAGFSTAAAVSAVSGRGVGLDVVRTNIERIGGTIELRSSPGQGSVFIIRIPLTLAIVPALIVAAGGERFAIAQLGVVELVRPGEGTDSAIERIGEARVLRLRERVLPLVDLGRLLALDPPRGQVADGDGFVVVVQVGPHGFGIIVENIFDTEEVVVRPLAPILRHLTLFAGSTILGDGSVIMILDAAGIARASGVCTTRAVAVAPPAPPGRIERTALLLFRAGDETPKAVPLGLVARLENVPRAAIETAGGRRVMQHRGQLVPLVAMPGISLAAPAQPVLVFIDGNRSMGLMVDAILDVVEERLEVARSADQPGLLGTALIAGRASEVLDAGYWLRQAFADWFMRTDAERAPAARPHLLVVEDSAFFRDLLAPTLAAAGYDVTTAMNGAAALRLRDQGLEVDCIISDIEMPELDGCAFMRAVRAGGAWAGLPAVALSSRTGAADLARGRAAGFTDYVAKFDRAAILAAIAGALRAHAETAAKTAAETAAKTAAKTGR